MKFAFIFPFLLAIVIFAFIMWLKTKMPLGKFRKIMLIVTAICALLSVISVIASAYFSQDKSQLTKLSLPGLLLILTIVLYKKTKQKNL